MAQSNPSQNTAEYISSATQPTQITYLSIVNLPDYPTEEQTIIFAALENTPIQDYLIPLGS